MEVPGYDFLFLAAVVAGLGFDYFSSVDEALEAVFEFDSVWVCVSPVLGAASDCCFVAGFVGLAYGAGVLPVSHPGGAVFGFVFLSLLSAFWAVCGGEGVFWVGEFGGAGFAFHRLGLPGGSVVEELFVVWDPESF